MKPSVIASGCVIGLLMWGAIFILLRWIGWINWPWFWTMSPIYLAVVICIVMALIAVVLGLEF